MLNATWGYIDGKITKTTPVAQAQGLLVGNRLTKTPKNKISLAAQYDWEIFGSDDLPVILRGQREAPKSKRLNSRTHAHRVCRRLLEKRKSQYRRDRRHTRET